MKLLCVKPGDCRTEYLDAVAVRISLKRLLTLAWTAVSLLGSFQRWPYQFAMLWLSDDRSADRTGTVSKDYKFLSRIYKRTLRPELPVGLHNSLLLLGARSAHGPIS